MYCPRCGDTNHDSDRFCSSCGQDLVTYRQLWSGATPQATAVGVSPPVSHPAAPLAAPHATRPPAAAQSPAASQTAPVTPSFAQPQAAAPVTEAPQIPNYLGWAAMLLALCWPAFWAGVTALVYAGRTESRLAAGDLVGARESSRKAKEWCWVTFIAGLLLWVIALSLVLTL